MLLQTHFSALRNDEYEVIIASNNKKKLAELERILNPLGINAVTPKEEGITLDDVEENGTTFAENAFLKANAAYLKTGLPAVADDSGLCVDALDGRPGVYTARYGGEGLTDEERYIKLLDEMKMSMMKSVLLTSLLQSVAFFLTVQR